MRKRLGCLSPGGIIATVVTLIVVGLLVLFTGGSLFSPGPLNAESGSVALGGVTSHAEIGGRCGACHAAPWSEIPMSERCTACHTAVRDQLSLQTALHGALQAELGSLLCRECHPEHSGATGALTLVEEEGFPHQAVGFSLTGHAETAAGEPFECRDCHGDDLTAFDLTACQSCHEELAPSFMSDHRATFGLACLDCHDGLDTYGEAFDHDRQRFPLVGLHTAIVCAGCHAGARTPSDLRQTPVDCFACHAQDDSHEGRLGRACEACHTPADWGEASIDHSLTAFPLTGAHLDVDCEGCHENQVFVGTPTVCFTCHAEDDAHDGRLGRACEACHTPADWHQATIDHSLTAFPLTGAHLDVACESCHVNQVFAGTPQTCVGCHPEPGFHLGILGSDCAACHGTAGWLPALFDRAHQFPFSHGASAPSSCRTCHPDQLLSYTCYGCHEHNPADIEAEHLDEGIADFRDCANCHPTGQKDEAGDRGDDD